MTDQASLLERVRAPGFINKWRKAFEGVRDIFITEGAPIPRQQANEYTGDALWLTIEKPCPGIHLLSIKMPKRLPLSMRLHVWVEKGQDALYRRLRDALVPVIRGETPKAFLNASPNSSYRSSLAKNKGIELIGLIFFLRNLDFLNNEALVRPCLHTIGLQFCSWVLAHAEERWGVPAGDEEEEVLADVDGARETEEEVGQDPRFVHVNQKTRRALVNARIGQGGYRQRLLRLWGARCAVTDCDINEALIASHAKAWRDCDVRECLDPYNGLPLVASLDRLFDKGLISFANNGQLLKAPSLSWGRLEILDVHRDSRMRMVHIQHGPYLAAHRARHGYPA